jgi:two-component system sensor histidine kinase VanS
MTTNLVHNAIVHNLPEQGTVWVKTSVRPETVVLAVENSGEKLSPQLVSTLTEPFQRGTKRIRNDHTGVGLGLAIVKSITQVHDGTLTLTARAAGGLCVAVQLPAAVATYNQIVRGPQTGVDPPEAGRRQHVPPRPRSAA